MNYLSLNLRILKGYEGRFCKAWLLQDLKIVSGILFLMILHTCIKEQKNLTHNSTIRYCLFNENRYENKKKASPL